MLGTPTAPDRPTVTAPLITDTVVPRTLSVAPTASTYTPTASTSPAPTATLSRSISVTPEPRPTDAPPKARIRAKVDCGGLFLDAAHSSYSGTHATYLWSAVDPSADLQRYLQLVSDPPSNYSKLYLDFALLPRLSEVTFHLELGDRPFYRTSQASITVALFSDVAAHEVSYDAPTHNTSYSYEAIILDSSPYFTFCTGMQLEWFVLRGPSIRALAVNRATMELPRYFLQPNETSRFVFRATLPKAGKTYSVNVRWTVVPRRGAVRAVLPYYGLQTIAYNTSLLMLDASQSYSEDAAPGTPIPQGDPARQFSWSICPIDGAGVPDCNAPLPRKFADLDKTFPTLNLTGSSCCPLPVGPWQVSVTFSYFQRNSTAALVLEVVPYEVPLVDLVWMAAEDPLRPRATVADAARTRYNPTDPLRVAARVQGLRNGSATYAWQAVADGFPLNLTAVADVGPANQSLKIHPNVLRSAKSVSVELVVSPAAGRPGRAQLDVRVNAAPAGGRLVSRDGACPAASPCVVLEAVGWTDPDGTAGALQYQFYLADPVLRADVWLTAAAGPDPQLTVPLPLLPEATVLFYYVVVSDADGGRNTSRARVAVASATGTVGAIGKSLVDLRTAAQDCFAGCRTLIISTAMSVARVATFSPAASVLQQQALEAVYDETIPAVLDHVDVPLTAAEQTAMLVMMGVLGDHLGALEGTRPGAAGRIVVALQSLGGRIPSLAPVLTPAQQQQTLKVATDVLGYYQGQYLPAGYTDAGQGLISALDGVLERRSSPVQAQVRGLRNATRDVALSVATPLLPGERACVQDPAESVSVCALGGRAGSALNFSLPAGSGVYLPASWSARTGVAPGAPVRLLVENWQRKSPHWYSRLSNTMFLSASLVSPGGARLPVSGLRDAAQLRIAYPALETAREIACRFFDTVAERWERAGVVYAPDAARPGVVTCRTTHLTDFTAHYVFREDPPAESPINFACPECLMLLVFAAVMAYSIVAAVLDTGACCSTRFNLYNPWAAPTVALLYLKRSIPPSFCGRLLRLTGSDHALLSCFFPNRKRSALQGGLLVLSHALGCLMLGTAWPAAGVDSGSWFAWGVTTGAIAFPVMLLLGAPFFHTPRCNWNTRHLERVREPPPPASPPASDAPPELNPLAPAQVPLETLPESGPPRTAPSRQQSTLSSDTMVVPEAEGAPGHLDAEVATQPFSPAPRALSLAHDGDAPPPAWAEPPQVQNWMHEGGMQDALRPAASPVRTRADLWGVRPLAESPKEHTFLRHLQEDVLGDAPEGDLRHRALQELRDGRYLLAVYCLLKGDAERQQKGDETAGEVSPPHRFVLSVSSPTRPGHCLVWMGQRPKRSLCT